MAATAPTTHLPVAIGVHVSIADELQKLVELRAQGMLGDGEFDLAKAQILGTTPRAQLPGAARASPAYTTKPWCAPDALSWLQSRKPGLGCGKIDRALAVQIANMAAPPAGTTGPPRIFLNVGANKGYEIAELLETWRPHLNVTRLGWYRLIKLHAKASHSRYLSWSAVGACHEGKAAAPKKKSKPPAIVDASPVEIHAFELHPATARLLRHLVNATGASSIVKVITISASHRAHTYTRICTLAPCQLFSLEGV